MKFGVRNKALAAASLVAACACLATGAKAASVSKSFTMSATVNPACTLTVNNMNFGTLTAVTGTETANTTFTIVCSQNLFVQASFTPTFSVANTTKNSVLTNAGGKTINYNLTLLQYQGTVGTGGAFGNIRGQLSATPNVASGVYKSVETLYINY